MTKFLQDPLEERNMVEHAEDWPKPKISENSLLTTIFTTNLSWAIVKKGVQKVRYNRKNNNENDGRKYVSDCILAPGCGSVRFQFWFTVFIRTIVA
jgi:hypothetical protein